MHEPPTFVMISGLPGTGKSTLADGMSKDLEWRVIAIDEVAEEADHLTGEDAHSFWDRAIVELLRRARDALERGDSVIVDHVFMNRDRFHAAAIARSTGAKLRPIHTFVSDRQLWRARVDSRHRQAQHPDVATWDRIVLQEAGYLEWDPDTALFLNTLRPIEECLEAAVEYVTADRAWRRGLPITPNTPGDHHGT